MNTSTNSNRSGDYNEIKFDFMEALSIIDENKGQYDDHESVSNAVEPHTQSFTKFSSLPVNEKVELSMDLFLEAGRIAQKYTHTVRSLGEAKGIAGTTRNSSLEIAYIKEERLRTRQLKETENLIAALMTAFEA